MIYLLTCKTCDKQHIGKTTDHFRGRWNSHQTNVRKIESANMENVKQKLLQIFFSQGDRQGFLKDLEVRLTDKTHASNSTKREFYWISTL